MTVTYKVPPNETPRAGAPRQPRPEYSWAFPYPLITSTFIPLSTCQCSWAWTPQLGGDETPYVLKFFHRGCRIHHVEAAMNTLKAAAYASYHK